jgi:hypothetical protein
VALFTPLFSPGTFVASLKIAIPNKALYLENLAFSEAIFGSASNPKVVLREYRQATFSGWERAKKKGASGITTLAPYVAGQWGRGNNRLPG